jgi:4-amino-4-deoxy-L-arabinose transferase-like glycosyltransferase
LRALLALDRRDIAVSLLLLVVGSTACFMNLDASVLWQDEAQTAVVSRTILEHGIPLGTDGVNFFSQEYGAEYADGYVWRWHTWLPFYFVAGSFALFGETTWAARFPFALFGLATLLLAYPLGRRVWQDRWAAAASAVALATSVPFLLMVRQCRYYSMTAFFTVLALWAYLRLVEGARAAGPVFALALFGLFQSHYVYIPPLVASLAIHALLFHRDRFKAGAVWTTVAGVACLPWGIWMAGIRYGEAYGETLIDVGHRIGVFLTFGDALLRFVFPLGLFVVLAVVVGWHAYRKTPRLGSDATIVRGATLILLLVSSHLIVLSFVAPTYFFRYLMPLIPVLALGAGRIVAAPLAGPWALKIALLVGLIALGPVGAFVHELRHDFEGPVEELVRYLDEHAEPGDVVAINYGDMALKFYGRYRVVGGMTGEDLGPAQDADWIIIRRHSVRDGSVGKALRRIVLNGDYEPVLLERVDTGFENREDPEQHLYRTATLGPALVVHRRRSSTEPEEPER